MAHSEITAREVYHKTAAEVRLAAVDMRGVLRQGEILTGSPTVSASGITVGSGAVTTSAQVINGQSVEAGKAVTFSVSAGTAATDYLITISCGTSLSQTVNTCVIVNVRAPTTSAP
jgi:hypothetical protein